MSKKSIALQLAILLVGLTLFIGSYTHPSLFERRPPAMLDWGPHMAVADSIPWCKAYWKRDERPPAMPTQEHTYRLKHAWAWCEANYFAEVRYKE